MYTVYGPQIPYWQLAGKPPLHYPLAAPTQARPAPPQEDPLGRSSLRSSTASKRQGSTSRPEGRCAGWFARSSCRPWHRHHRLHRRFPRPAAAAAVTPVAAIVPATILAATAGACRALRRVRGPFGLWRTCRGASVPYLPGLVPKQNQIM